MKVAIAIVQSSFAAGSIASICVCEEEDALFNLRTINGCIEDVDVRFYLVDHDATTCNFSEGFISNEGTMEIKGNGEPFKHKFVCRLTVQKK